MTGGPRSPCVLLLAVAGCGGLERTSTISGGGVVPVDAGPGMQDDSSSSAMSDAQSMQDAAPARDGSPAVGCSSQGPTVVASYVYSPVRVAVDATNIYFSALDNTTEADAIYQIAKGAPAGTQPLELSYGDGQPASLTTDGSYVYWFDAQQPGSSIRRIAPGGMGATTLLALDNVWNVALSPTSLFWMTGTGSVQSMPKAGGPVGSVAAGPAGEPLAVALDASFFYFSSSSTSTLPLTSTIGRVPLAGGQVTTLATAGTYVTTLAVDATSVYFVAGDDLTRVPIAGGMPTVVAHGFDGAQVIEIDSGNLYASIWVGTDSTGLVVRIPVTGGTPTVIAGSQSLPRGLATDDSCIYWADFGGGNGGAIMAAPK